MAFNLYKLTDNSPLSGQFDTYGKHPQCLNCLNLDDYPNPQYNAPGIMFFHCADYEGKEES